MPAWLHHDHGACQPAESTEGSVSKREGSLASWSTDRPALGISRAMGNGEKREMRERRRSCAGEIVQLGFDGEQAGDEFETGRKSEGIAP